MKKVIVFSILLGAFFLPFGAVPDVKASDSSIVMWINHLDFLPGDPSVSTNFNAVNSGVGGGLSGLIIESTTPGENAEGGGNKVVEKGLLVPPGHLISGVRVCYESTSASAFISQIRLAQLKDPPEDSDPPASIALVVLDDPTDLTDPGPICVDSAAPLAGTIDPSLGAVRLNLRVNFPDPPEGERIVLRAVALHLEKTDTSSPLPNHTHSYLTGRGNGHNNVIATSGPGMVADDAVDESSSVLNHTHSYLTGKGRGHNKVEAETGPAVVSDETP